MLHKSWQTCYCDSLWVEAKWLALIENIRRASQCGCAYKVSNFSYLGTLCIGVDSARRNKNFECVVNRHGRESSFSCIFGHRN